LLAVICGNTLLGYLITKTTMKAFISFLIILCTFAILTKCKQKIKEGQKAEVAFFDPLKLGATNQTSNISFEARFDECGEWGGHKEKITVFADSNMSIHATYHVFPFNCDSLDYYTDLNLKPTVEKTIVLNDQDKESISGYIQRLTQSKITERFPGHSGNLFTLKNSDSTLFIQVYDRNEATVTSYKRLVTDLFE
jgi:hypothetical protein